MFIFVHYVHVSHGNGLAGIDAFAITCTL